MMKDHIKKELESIMTENNFSGVVSIKKSGEILYEGVKGFRDRSNELPVEIETKFGIASGTKLFTALGIAVLIEKGMLSLSDKVFDILDIDIETYDKEVTIEHLLTHTSGLPDYFDEDKVEDFDNFKVAVPWYDIREPQDYFPVLPREEMKFKPGDKFNYNNSGYVLLAAIIAEKSGLAYSTFILKEVIEPMGLVSTDFYPMNQLPKNTATGYITEENGWRTNVYNLPIVGGGDGGLFTTISDIYKLWEGVFSGRLISEELTEKIFKKHVQTKPNTDSYYGLGVWIYDAEGIPTEEYIMGADAGISFKTAFVREKDLIYTVISNTGEGAWPVLKAIVGLGLDTE